jgi:ketosteroid isomerase-like protein
MPHATHDHTTIAQDEAEIRRVMKAWSAALAAKDVAKLLADYAPDAVLYDAIPPYKTEGVDNIRKV